LEIDSGMAVTVNSTNIVYHIYKDKNRKEVIFIPYNLYEVLRKPKKFWHNHYIPPGWTENTLFMENREGIPMSSYKHEIDIGTFLCGFLVLWIKSNGARAPPLEIL
jgi:hypothetical protein